MYEQRTVNGPNLDKWSHCSTIYSTIYKYRYIV